MTQSDLTPLASLSMRQLRDQLTELGARSFVAEQIWRAVYERGVRTFDEISNVSKEVRGRLAERYALRSLKVAECARAADGSFKLLLELADGNLIECALLAAGDRGTVCVSSQVGCAMGCVFCASGERGLVRNLEPFEIVEQVLLARDHLVDTQQQRHPPAVPAARDGNCRTLTNVTVMGIGEPLRNLDNVLAALEVVNDPKGIGIGARRIAISTCGLSEGIRRLAEVDKQYNLAISLHAAEDALRAQLMPRAAGLATVAEVLAATEAYFRKTGRKVTFEVALMRGVNDSLEQARLLAQRLGGLACLVNLIPVNPTEGCPDLEPPTKTQLGRFQAELERAGVETCIRRRRGAEVHAACGQLRSRHARKLR